MSRRKGGGGGASSIEVFASLFLASIPTLLGTLLRLGSLWACFRRWMRSAALRSAALRSATLIVCLRGHLLCKIRGW